MLLSEYTVLAKRTAIYPPEVAVAYTVEEVMGEISEAVAVKHDADELFVELGDILWEIALANLELDLGIETDLSAPPETDGPLATTEVYMDQLVVSGGYFLSRHAKRLRDGADAVSDDVVRAALTRTLEDLRAAAHGILGQTLDVVAEANIAKLADRDERNVLRGSGDRR